MTSDIILFNFFRYALLLSFIISGIAILRNKTSNEDYWKLVRPSIIIYSLMEGLRWMRGQDYKYNLDISTLKDKSNDLIYDLSARVLYEFNFPFYVFFIVISFILIYSFCFLLRDYKKAYVFSIILMYSYSMMQSENLMRQYFAISLSIIAIKFLLDSKKSKAFFFFTLSVLSHFSSVILIPILLLYQFLKFKNAVAVFILKYLNSISLVLYLLVFIFSKQIQSFLSTAVFDFYLTKFSFNTDYKYLDDQYLTRALVQEESNYNLDSIVKLFRDLLRNLIVIILGYKLLNFSSSSRNLSGYFNISTNKLLLIYLFAVASMIIPWLIPTDLQMEVLHRIHINIEIWVYFLEGLIFYKFLAINPANDFKKNILKVLIVLEIIWIFKINVGDVLGLKFIWDRYSYHFN